MEEGRPRKLEGGPCGFGAVAILSAKWIDAFKIVDQILQEGSEVRVICMIIVLLKSFVSKLLNNNWLH